MNKVYSDFPYWKSTLSQDKWFVPLESVSEILKNIKNRTFQSWIPWAHEKKNSTFHSKKEGNSRNCRIQKTEKVSWLWLKRTHKFPYSSDLLNQSGSIIWSIDKWSEVLMDIENDSFQTFSTIHPSTGKYQAYVRVTWTLVGNTLNPIQWYVRAPWLDSRVNPQKKEWVLPPSSWQQVWKNWIQFEWYCWMDGRLLSPKSVKIVAIKYFWKKIIPLLLKNTIVWVNTKRSDIVEEVIAKWVKMTSSKAFPEYQEQLQRLKTYSSIKMKFENWQDITDLPIVTTILSQLQKRSEWKSDVLVWATLFERQSKRQRFL